jgi:hypothetical protein
LEFCSLLCTSSRFALYIVRQPLEHSTLKIIEGSMLTPISWAQVEFLMA